MTIRKIADGTGIPYSTTKIYVSTLRTVFGRAHIRRWRKTSPGSAAYTAIIRYGAGQDAERPEVAEETVRVLEACPEGPFNVRYLADRLNRYNTTIKYHLKKLIAAGQVRQVGEVEYEVVSRKPKPKSRPPRRPTPTSAWAMALQGVIP